MAPTTLPPAERPRVTPPWPRSPSCRTRNPHNVVGDVGILSSLGLPGRRVPMLVRAPQQHQGSWADGWCSAWTVALTFAL